MKNKEPEYMTFGEAFTWLLKNKDKYIVNQDGFKITYERKDGLTTVSKTKDKHNYTLNMDISDLVNDKFYILVEP